MESKKQKPKRKLIKRVIIGILVTLIVLDIGGAIATELTDSEPFVNNPAYPDQSGIVLKIGYDLWHPLGWIKNLNPDIPPTFDNNTDLNLIKAGINATLTTETDLNSVNNTINYLGQQESGEHATIELFFPALLQTGDQARVKMTPLTVQYSPSEPQSTLKSEYDITLKREGTQLASGIVDNDAVTLEVFKNPYIIHNGISYFNGITIRVTRRDGAKYEVYFSAQNILNLKPLSILEDAPTIEREEVLVGNHTEIRTENPNQPGKIISNDNPLLETTSKNTIVSYGLADNSITTNNQIIIFDKAEFITTDEGKLEYLPQP